MDRIAAGKIFRDFLATLPRGTATRIHIYTDADADGLPAAAILVRTLHHLGYTHVTAEPRRKYEHAWMPEVHARIASQHPEALLLVDVGARPDRVLPGVPTLLIDHHAPFGTPPGATLLTGYGPEPIPTSGLLAFWCAAGVSPELEHELLWLAAISLLSDLGDKAPFPELAEAKTEFGVTALKDLTSLLNAPRRSVSGDAMPALNVLLHGKNPKQILREESWDMTTLRNAKVEVSAALASARKARPYFSEKWRNELAEIIAIPINSLTQVHPLVALTWRSRFPKAVIFGVNTGFRPGYVYFSGRAPLGVDLVAFLRAHTPVGADGTFGGGHQSASSGALPVEIWNKFATELGFGPELQFKTSPAPQADLKFDSQDLA